MLITAAKKTPVSDGIQADCMIDIEDTIKPVYGAKKHGAEHGYTGVRGLNAQIATIITPTLPRCWQRVQASSGMLAIAARTWRLWRATTETHKTGCGQPAGSQPGTR